MSIFSKLASAIRFARKPKPAANPDRAPATAHTIPTVKFDPARVTESVQAKLKSNIRKLKEFDESHFARVYDAALHSISKGRDQATLFNAILGLNLPGMTKKRASEITLDLINKATALTSRDRQVALGIKYAIWVYSGAPCQLNPRTPSDKDIQQDAAHKAVNGKRYKIDKGLLLNGRLTFPGEEAGCKCISRPVIPGFD